MADLGSRLGSAFIEISPSLEGFGSSLQEGLSLAFGSTLATVGESLENAGKALFTKFTVPLAVATAANIAQFQALDREIRTTLTLFGTAPSLIDETFDRMHAGITTVSEDVGGLERDIADGLYQAISAGIPRDDVFAFLDVAQMAAMADKTADMTTAVDGITTVLNAFSAEGLDASQAADIMFATVAKGKTTFGELSPVIGRAAGIAANAGVKFAEFSAVVGALTLGGFQTSEAISFMRASITGLLRPSEDMNKIFQDIGFTSAETAIPVIGLQAAFQTVVDAAGGSTSRLQELIGTSEGVSAILGVTGANAEKFSGVLAGTENAAGQTARAYEIMEGAVGRSFGRMTESFDRLGNSLGKKGSAIVAPFADIVAGIVDRVRHLFDNVEPIIDSFIDLFSGFRKVFDIPGVTAFASAIFAVGVALSGLLGILGGLLIPFGKLLVFVGKGKAFLVMGNHASKLVATINTNFPRMIALITKFGEAIQRIPVVGAIAEKAVNRLTLAAGAGKAAMIGFSAALAGITAIVIAGALIWDNYKKRMAEMNAEAYIATEGLDRLASSVGVTLEEVGKLANLDEGFDFDIDVAFILENQGLLNRIERTQEALGDAAAKDIIIGVAYDLHSRGASPEETVAAVQKLQDALDLDFVFNVDTVGLLNVEDKLAEIVALATEVGDKTSVGILELGSAAQKVAQKDLENLGREVANIGITQGPEALVAAMDIVKDTIGDTGVEADFFGKSFLDAMEEGIEGTQGFQKNTGFLGQSLLTVSAALAQVTGVTGFDQISATAEEAAKDVLSVEEQFAETARALAAQTMPTPEWLQTQSDLIAEIPGIFDAARGEIDTIMADITQSVTRHMPVLGIYSGAIKQSFEDWTQGHLDYQKDIKAVSDLRATLMEQDVPQAVLDGFDQASLSDQAWLTTLAPENLEAAIQTLKDTALATGEAVGEKVTQETGNILDAAKVVIDEKWQVLLDEASTNGAGMANNVMDAFGPAADLWAGEVQGYMDGIQAIISGSFGADATISGPSFATDVSVVNNNVTINNATTNNLNSDAQKAGLYLNGLK